VNLDGQSLYLSLADAAMPYCPCATLVQWTSCALSRQY